MKEILRMLNEARKSQKIVLLQHWMNGQRCNLNPKINPI